MPSDEVCSCDDVRRVLKLAVQCCDSCHEDYDDYGYPMCGLDLPGGEVEVCCAVMKEAERHAE